MPTGKALSPGLLSDFPALRDGWGEPPYIGGMSSHTPTRDDDYVIDQGWKNYTADEHAVWDFLYRRQRDILGTRAHQALIDGHEALNLNRGGIPDFAVINEELKRRTGFTVVAVPGL